MSCQRFVVLLLLFANVSNQLNATEFRPLDENVVPIADYYLSQGKLQEEPSFLEKFLRGIQSLFDRESLREREAEIVRAVKQLLRKYDNYNLTKGIELKRVGEVKDNRIDEDDSVIDTLDRYARQHVIKVHFSDLYEDVAEKIKRSTELVEPSGRSFGLKKLMVPFMMGAQILKSVLIAMFLPSIIGGLGRLVGKGVSTFATASHGYGQPYGHPNYMMHDQMEDFEFKDQGSYDGQQYQDLQQPESSNNVFSYTYPNHNYDYGRLHQQMPIGVLPAQAQSISNRFTPGSHKVSYLPNNNHHGSFYTKHHKKQQSYKIFHNIPSSSLLLTNYDPFYSPLLSRMDSVFKQLGYETEACRERLICLMYKNPAKFAPYSNLISAQLSRELNELRKPSTDNPDILRFFKYMKSAKDGQDGLDCVRIYSACLDSRETVNPPMVKTYNEINKLVHARKLS